MAKPTSESLPSLLVTELWGLGDLALALPFLHTATSHARVFLLAKPHAAPLLRRFAPQVTLVPLTAPWTSFSGKYRLHRWPWHALAASVGAVRRLGPPELGVSARPDPRDHLLLTAAGARRRLGFARAGSGLLLTDSLPPPQRVHRSAYWDALASALDWPQPASVANPEKPPQGQPHLVIHTGAGHAVRQWPRDRYEQIAGRVRGLGWRVTVLDDSLADLDTLLATLATADRFLGNDSGPGHLAALLGVPTFTVFGPQLPERFAPVHPRAAWVDGAACPHKPCFDACRFAEPHCLLGTSTETVWLAVSNWLSRET